MSQPIRVLLIDDHPIVRSGIRMLLEQAGDILVVGEADRGDDALGLVKRLKPDVLLLDMEMPGKTGVEVARELKAASAPVRVLALSAYDDEQYILNLLAEGAVGYLTKEEALDTIVDAVHGVARGEEGWFSRRATARIASVHLKERNKDPLQLTERETEVLNLLKKGWANSRIAEELFLSERTVRFHLTNVYDKLGVSSRAEAISWALTQDDDA
ncbi:MAG: response regulator transcription factor [Caldilineaceae bacterium]